MRERHHRGEIYCQRGCDLARGEPAQRPDRTRRRRIVQQTNRCRLRIGERGELGPESLVDAGGIGQIETGKTIAFAREARMAPAADAEHGKIALEQRRGERRAEAARDSGYDRCVHDLSSAAAPIVLGRVPQTNASNSATTSSATGHRVKRSARATTHRCVPSESAIITMTMIASASSVNLTQLFGYSPWIAPVKPLITA